MGEFFNSPNLAGALVFAAVAILLLAIVVALVMRTVGKRVESRSQKTLVVRVMTLPFALNVTNLTLSLYLSMAVYGFVSTTAGPLLGYLVALGALAASSLALGRLLLTVADRRTAAGRGGM